MQRIQYLTLLAVALLVCASGCVKQYLPGGYGRPFEVDGIAYWLDQHASVDKRGQVDVSFILVGLYSDRFGGGWLVVSAKHRRADGKSTWQFSDSFGDDAVSKNTVPKNNTLYFVQNKEILFEKDYQELESTHRDSIQLLSKMKMLSNTYVPFSKN